MSGTLYVSQEVIDILFECHKRGIDVSTAKIGRNWYVVGIPRNLLTQDLQNRMRKHKQELLNVLGYNVKQDRLILPKTERPQVSLWVPKRMG